MNRRELIKLIGGTTAAIASNGLVASCGMPEIRDNNSSYLKILTEKENRFKRYARYEVNFASLSMQQKRMFDTYVGELAVNIYEDLKLKEMAWVEISPFSLGVLIANAAIYGDVFYDNYLSSPLPLNTMYRIETIKGKLLEFQQSNSGPDYKVIAKSFEEKLETVIRFKPDEIIHIRPNCYKYYPYGTSILETGIITNDKVFEDNITREIKSAIKTLYRRNYNESPRNV